jgi:hypothetical protein
VNLPSRRDRKLRLLANAILWAKSALTADDPDQSTTKKFLMSNRELIEAAMACVSELSENERESLYRSNRKILSPPGGSDPEYATVIFLRLDDMSGLWRLSPVEEDHLTVLSRVVDYASFVIDATALPDVMLPDVEVHPYLLREAQGSMEES